MGGSVALTRVCLWLQWMRYIYKMQNLTFGEDGGLTKACQEKHPDEPGLCFMSPHMQDVIKTPFFMFNSKYDAWQLGSEFQSNWKTKPEQDGVSTPPQSASCWWSFSGDLSLRGLSLVIYLFFL